MNFIKLHFENWKNLLEFKCSFKSIYFKLWNGALALAGDCIFWVLILWPIYVNKLCSGFFWTNLFSFSAQTGGLTSAGSSRDCTVEGITIPKNSLALTHTQYGSGKHICDPIYCFFKCAYSSESPNTGITTMQCDLVNTIQFLIFNNLTTVFMPAKRLWYDKGLWYSLCSIICKWVCYVLFALVIFCSNYDNKKVMRIFSIYFKLNFRESPTTPTLLFMTHIGVLALTLRTTGFEPLTKILNMKKHCSFEQTDELTSNKG